MKRVVKSYVTSTMFIRASINHSAVRMVKEEIGSNLIELNCHLHPLDSFGSKCKTILEATKKGCGEKSELYGSVYGAELIILGYILFQCLILYICVCPRH